MLTRIKSTLSTVTSTLQAVRELPGAVKEAIAFTRENSDVIRELEAANAQLNKGLTLHLEWMEKCIKLNDELSLVEFIANEAWLWAKERITQLQLDNSSLGNALALEHELAVRFSSLHDEATTKLARYEAAEKWLSRWRWNRETPCPFPPDAFVQYRECEQVTPSSPNENHANEPLKEMSHTCMVSELSDSDEWRPHVECLKFYEAFKDV